MPRSQARGVVLFGAAGDVPRSGQRGRRWGRCVVSGLHVCEERVGRRGRQQATHSWRNPTSAARGSPGAGTVGRGAAKGGCEHGGGRGILRSRWPRADSACGRRRWWHGLPGTKRRRKSVIATTRRGTTPSSGQPPRSPQSRPLPKCAQWMYRVLLRVAPVFAMGRLVGWPCHAAA